MSEIKTGYRAFPPIILHPKNLTNLSTEEFDAAEKTQMESAPPVCEGHAGTAIWFTNSGYIVQVKTISLGDFFIVSPGTIAPSMGMDSIDGMFAQDAEEYILSIKLNYKTGRLDVFEENDNINTKTYLENRGVIGIEEPVVSKAININKTKKWWKFW